MPGIIQLGVAAERKTVFHGRITLKEGKGSNSELVKGVHRFSSYCTAQVTNKTILASWRVHVVRVRRTISTNLSRDSNPENHRCFASSSTATGQQYKVSSGVAAKRPDASHLQELDTEAACIRQAVPCELKFEFWIGRRLHDHCIEHQDAHPFPTSAVNTR